MGKENATESINHLMIIAKFNKNIKLCEIDEFVTRLKNKAKKKNKVMLDLKLTSKDCTVYISQKWRYY